LNNIILAEHYVCSEELLEARVVLLYKDHGNPTLLANYRPIALCNYFYQLINIIITSRIQGLTEKICSAGILATWLSRLSIGSTCHPEGVLALK